jgi:hypothetical protein
MQRLVCTLAAVVSVALGSGIFADVDDVHHLVTSTVVSVNVGYMEIDTHDGVGAGVNRLRVHTHFAALALNTAFEKIGNTQNLTDGLRIARDPRFVLHH